MAFYDIAFLSAVKFMLCYWDRYMSLTLSYGKQQRSFEAYNISSKSIGYNYVVFFKSPFSFKLMLAQHSGKSWIL